MTEKSGTDQSQDAFSTDWAKALNEFWNPFLNPWGGGFQSPEGPESSQFKGRIGESIQSTLKMWQTTMSAMSEPSTLANFQKAAQMTPDLVLGITQSCLKGFTTLQAQISDWMQKREESLSIADIQELDRELIRNWTNIYEKEFSQYLKLPQIGLTRLYQERVFQAADKMTTFQAVLSQFLHMLYTPIEKSLKSLQEKMAEMTEAGPLDEKSKTYYDLWIKLLEGHYMELFKQPEYSDELAKTLSALNEFVLARRAVVNDITKQLDVPSNEDMDELYREIYLLKKELRAIKNT